MITAARYLLVTSILYVKSHWKLIPCPGGKGEKYLIPNPTGVCYPVPYGSASYKSDYDVGLIGAESGSLTKKFNEYFQSTFRRPSELVFDTNVYAFTLEFAIPSMFKYLPWTFKTQLTNDERTDEFKLQELASAYFKVFKYNIEFFEMLKKNALTAMTGSGKEKLLNHWLNMYSGMDRVLGMRSDSPAFNNNPQSLREAHNTEYQKIVKSMSDARPTPYQAKFLGNYRYLYNGLYKTLVIFSQEEFAIKVQTYEVS